MDSYVLNGLLSIIFMLMSQIILNLTNGSPGKMVSEPFVMSSSFWKYFLDFKSNKMFLSFVLSFFFFKTLFYLFIYLADHK